MDNKNDRIDFILGALNGTRSVNETGVLLHFGNLTESKLKKVTNDEKLWILGLFRKNRENDNYILSRDEMAELARLKRVMNN